MSPEAPEKQSKYRTLAIATAARFPEAEVPHVGQDDVVDHLDAHQRPRLHHALGQRDVLHARRRIARRMIVKQHQRRRAAGRGGAENLPRMHQAGVQRAGREHGRPAAPDASCPASPGRTARRFRPRSAATGTPRPRAGCAAARARRASAPACAGPARPRPESAPPWPARPPSPGRNCPSDNRVNPCNPPAAPNIRLAMSRALARRCPWPRTTARSSLSPRTLEPNRSSFSRGRSCSGKQSHAARTFKPCAAAPSYYRVRAGVLAARRAARTPTRRPRRVRESCQPRHARYGADNQTPRPVTSAQPVR